MTDTNVQSMPCPKCGVMHKLGAYRTWPPEDGKVYCAPPDVQCPCGLVLRHAVPIFMVDPFGWHWLPKPDRRPLRM
jgi:hypothetical protein